MYIQRSCLSNSSHINAVSAGGGCSDPTYELACLKRANEKTESLKDFIENSRNMFLLQVRLRLRRRRPGASNRSNLNDKSPARSGPPSFSNVVSLTRCRTTRRARHWKGDRVHGCFGVITSFNVGFNTFDVCLGSEKKILFQKYATFRISSSRL